MIAAFLQLRNELENGHLIRCLENCKKWADEIFIFDDCSTDNSRDVYLQYTNEKNIIFSTQRSFDREIFNKQRLLDLVLTRKPSWIVWQDGDAILDATLTCNLKYILKTYEKKYDGLKVHYLNLWRHPAYYRLDNGFNRLKYVAFWKNNGKLRYEPKEGLHLRQYPLGIEKIYFLRMNHIIHFGFSTKKDIVRKYLTYKSYNATKYERLIDEQTSFQVAKVPIPLYPIENIPHDYDTAPPPTPISYEEYKQYNSWEEFLSKTNGQII